MGMEERPLSVIVTVASWRWHQMAVGETRRGANADSEYR